MKSIIVYPKNEKQKNLLQSLLEEMKVRYIIDKAENNSKMTKEEFFQKIDSSLDEAEKGKTIKISKEEQKTLLGL
ncbi:MAG: hypothetical protein ACOVQR_11570 [Flavobacterium sp.]|jgi:hypothetical protein|uniref:hypothetical protein n=1 Tax=Flavobacterium sp. TaxID=239 RepID=UPI003BA6739D